MDDFNEWSKQVNAEILRLSDNQFDRESLIESGPLPFDWPDVRTEHEVGTSPTEVAQHMLWCNFPHNYEPVL